MNNTLIGLFRNGLEDIKTDWTLTETYGGQFKVEDRIKDELGQLREMIADYRGDARRMRQKFDRWENRRGLRWPDIYDGPKDFEDDWRGEMAAGLIATADALSAIRDEYKDALRWKSQDLNRSIKETTKLRRELGLDEEVK